MKFDKPKGDNNATMGPNDKFDDGTTPAQRSNARAIYEDPSAYAEWRIRMGLAKALEIKPNLFMRQRVAALFRELAESLNAVPRPREKWEPPPARKMTVEELSAHYAANPVKLSPDALKLRIAAE